MVSISMAKICSGWSMMYIQQFVRAFKYYYTFFFPIAHLEINNFQSSILHFIWLTYNEWQDKESEVDYSNSEFA